MADTDLGNMIIKLLVEDEQFKKSMKEALKLSEDTEDNFKKASQNTKNFMDGMNQISNGLLVAGGAGAAFSGLMIKEASDWQSAFADVSSVLEMTGTQMENLRKLAVDFSNDNKIASDNIIKSYYDMGSAGMDYIEIMSSASKIGTLAIATSAVGQDMGSAMDQATDVFTGIRNGYKEMFDEIGLSAEQAADKIVNTVAGTVKAYKTTLPQMKEAFKDSMSISAQYGIELEELASALGYFQSNSINASSAGTAMRNMLSRLATRAKEVGIEVFDSSGKMIPFADSMDKVREYLDGFEDASERATEASKLFGEETLNTALIAMKGTDAIRDQTQAVKESAAAEEMAAERQKDIQSKLLIMKNQIENALASAGDFILPVFEEIMGVVGDLIKNFNNLSPEIKEMLVKFTAFGSVGALAAGGIMKTVVSVYNFTEALRKMQLISSITNGLKGFGIGISNVSILMKNGIEGIRNFSNGLSGLGKASVTGGIIALTALITSMVAEIIKAGQEGEQLFKKVNESAGGALEQMEQWYHKIPLIGGVFKANLVEDWAKNTTKSLQESTALMERLANAKRNGFDSSLMGEDWKVLKAEVQEFVTMVDSLSDQELKGIFGDNSPGIRKTVSWMKEMIAEADAATEVTSEMTAEYERFMKVLDSGELKTPEQIAEFVKQLEEFKKTLPADSALAKELTTVIENLGKESENSAAKVKKASEALTKTLEGYEKGIKEIDLNAGLFDLTEWEALEEKTALQKQTLESLAAAYVNGEITQEEYSKSIAGLSAEYKKNAAALEEHNKQIEEQKKIEEGLTETLEKQAEAREEFRDILSGVDSEIKKRIELARLEGEEIDEAKIKQEVYSESLKKALEIKEEMGTATQEELESLNTLRKNLEAVIEEQKAHARALEEQTEAIENTSKAYDEQAKNLKAIGESLENFSGSNQTYIQEGEELKNQYIQLANELQGYKNELAELEKLKGTDAFDSERVATLKAAIESTGIAIEELGIDFKNLAMSSDVFSGIIDSLNLDLKRSEISFDVWGDSLKKMEDDISAHKKAIDSLLEKKASSTLTPEEEAMLQKEISLHKDLALAYEAQKKALEEAEAIKKRFTELNEELNNSLAENETFFKHQAIDYEEYLKNKVSAFESAQKKLLELEASGKITEQESEKLKEITESLKIAESAWKSYTEQKEKTDKVNENFAKSMDNISKKLKELEKFQGTPLEKAEKKFEILSDAVEELSSDFDDMDDSQKEAYANLSRLLSAAAEEVENLKKPFEEIEELQENISTLELRIEVEQDVDKKIDLIKEKIEVLKETAKANISISADPNNQEIIDKLAVDIKKEQDAISKLLEDSAKGQIESIKRSTKGSVTETLKAMQELEKGFKSSVKEKMLNPEAYAKAVEEIANAVGEAADAVKEKFEELEKSFNTDASPLDNLRTSTQEQLDFLNEVKETGVYELERILNLRNMIIEDAKEKEAELLEENENAFINSFGGDIEKINNGIDTIREAYDKREKIVKEYAKEHLVTEEWLSEQLDRIYNQRQEATSVFFDELLANYTNMFKNFDDMNIFQKKEAILQFKAKFPTAEDFRDSLVSSLEELRNSGQLTDMEFDLGMEKIEDKYTNVKNLIEKNPIEIAANVENALTGINNITGVLSEMSRLFKELAKQGGEFGETMGDMGGVAETLGGMWGGVGKIVSGVGTGDWKTAISGAVDYMINYMNLQKAYNEMITSSEEKESDLNWAKKQDLSDVLDYSKFEGQANLDFWDHLHFWDRSAAQERFFQTVQKTLDEQVTPLIENTKKVAEEYGKLGEEAKETGLENLANYYETASEKMAGYSEKIKKLNDSILDEAGKAHGANYGALPQKAKELEALQDEVKQVLNFTETLKGAYGELEKNGLQDSPFADAFEEMAKEATEAMEKGLDFGPIAEKAENFKVLLETVGPSLQKITENLSHLGLASGKYSEEINNLNQAYIDGKITQEEYIQSIETLSDKIEVLSAAHKKVDEAISKSGKASVFLKEQLNELDKAFTDGEKSESEYLKSLEELGVKSEKIAGSYEIIREAVQKVGAPVEILAEKFNELVDSFDSGTISEEQFMAGLDLLKDKAETVVTAFNRFDESIGKINSAFDGTDITIGQRFTEEFQELRTALENGEIDLNTFLQKIGELSNEAERFYSTFEGVKNTISSGLSGALENYITFEFDDSMMGDLQAFVERTKGAVYESSEDFAAAFSEMGKAGQTALIEEFKYDKFKQSLDETLKKAILDSLLESLMAEAAIQGQIQKLAAFIAAAMKDGLSQGEIDAMKTMMGDMQAVASEMASVVAETWTGLDNEIQTSSEEIQQIIQDTLSGVEEVGDEATQKIADTGQTLADELNTELGRIPEQVGEQTQQIVDETTEKVKEIPKIVDEALVDTGATIADSIGDIPTEVKNQTDQATQELKNGLETLPGVVSEITDGVVTELGNMYAAINPDGTAADGLTEITEMAANKMAILEEFKANMAGTTQEIMSENLGMIETEVIAQLLDISKQAIDGQLVYFTDVLALAITDSGIDIDTLTTQIETEFSALIDSINIKTDEYSTMRLQKQTESMNRYKLLTNQTGTELSNMVNSVYSAIEGYAQRTAGTIQSVMQALLGNIRAVISQAQEAMQAVRQAQAASASGSSSSSSSRPTYKAFADGGFITSDGLAYLHTGEMVVPRIATGKIFGQDIPNISNNSTSNSSQVTVSIAEGAIRVVGGNADPEAVAEKVMEKLSTGLSDSARRYSEVKP